MNSKLAIITKDKTLLEILNKCVEGKPISKENALYILDSKEKQDILKISSYLKNLYKNKTITYSRKIFINITNLCRDFCSYCTYRKNPYENGMVMMKPDEVIRLSEIGRKYKCTEALIVAGERPEERYNEAKQWLNSLDYKSLAEYVSDISETIVKKTGLIPHSNIGNLDKNEMKSLKEYNISLGIMLESSSERLQQNGMPHEYAPSKNPKKRLKTIENAGQLNIPITTGLLIGIGETKEEIIDSIYLLNEINNKYGNLQEIIVQNFKPHVNTKMQDYKSPSQDYFLKIVALTRLIMPRMNIQIPPNLNLNTYGSFIDSGINDWGGISPVTRDYVNPEFSWPLIKDLSIITRKKGNILRARLPIYPEFLNDKKQYVSSNLFDYYKDLIDDTGLIREEYLKN
ncbi:MAG: 7,8-didemethyl-8-hydroxy-5-deazariboflavin synthase CofG [Nitrososphaeraceae archaeon]